MKINIQTAPDRNEYVAVMYGTAALTTVADIAMGNAFDELTDYTDYPLSRDIAHQMKLALWGMQDTHRAMKAVIACRADDVWLQDFGRTVYGLVADHVERLRYAIANSLGKCQGLQRPAAVAMLLTAQYLAHEAAAYATGRAQRFRGCKVRNWHGSMISVKNLLEKVACTQADKAMATMAALILAPVMEQGCDYLADPTVNTGCAAIVKTLVSEDTWRYALSNTDKLNGTHYA